MTPLGVICSSLLGSERRILYKLQTSPCFSFFLSLVFLPQVYFDLSFFLIISLFVSIPSLMFVSPLRNGLSFFEYVCV